MFSFLMSGGTSGENLPASSGDKRNMCAIPGLWRSPGGGPSNPLQYSCLENPMVRGAWRVTVHRVEKSLLKWLCTHAVLHQVRLWLTSLPWGLALLRAQGSDVCKNISFTLSLGKHKGIFLRFLLWKLGGVLDGNSHHVEDFPLGVFNSPNYTHWTSSSLSITVQVFHSITGSGWFLFMSLWSVKPRFLLFIYLSSTLESVVPESPSIVMNPRRVVNFLSLFRLSLFLGWSGIFLSSFLACELKMSFFFICLVTFHCMDIMRFVYPFTCNIDFSLAFPYILALL